LGVLQTDINSDRSFDRGDVGFAGGVQGGFNWQLAPSWVIGLEGDIGYLGIDRSVRLALLWQNYSRRCFSPICLLQYGHR
jgi:hypothetical protein